MIEHRCDCTTATIGDKTYAGRYCQFESTVFCTDEQTENGKLFCVNGGTCRANAIEGCDCPSDYYGDSCEYLHLPQDFTPSAAPDNASPAPTILNNTNLAPTEAEVPASPVAALDTSAPVGAPAADVPTNSNPLEQLDFCSLQCQNDGKCRKGVKDLGVISNIAPHVAELNQTSNADFEYCICHPGFIGLHCEHKIEICLGGEHVCLHGSTCVAYGNELSCDCSASTSFTLAGPSCEHKNFVTCNLGEVHAVQPRSFCVNGGICNSLVSGSEAHPGCECPDEQWVGPHCELRKASVDTETQLKVVDSSSYASSGASDSNNSNSNNGGSTGILIVGILALVASLAVMIHTHIRNKNERRRMEQERNLTLALASRRELESNGVQNFAAGEPEVYLGPPHDEDGHELHQIEIL